MSPEQDIESTFWYCTLTRGVPYAFTSPIRLVIKNASLGRLVNKKKGHAESSVLLRRQQGDTHDMSYLFNLTAGGNDHRVLDIEITDRLPGTTYELEVEGSNDVYLIGSMEGTAARVSKSRHIEPKPRSVVEKLKALTRTTMLKTVACVSVSDTILGTGEIAQYGDKVSIRYRMRLHTIDGKVIRENVAKNDSLLVFQIGSNTVVKGFSHGIMGMSVNGFRIIYIPSTLGYGRRKVVNVPKDSDLYIECELVSINN